MKCTGCNSEILQSKPKLCPYCGSKNLVSSEQQENSSTQEIILVESQHAVLFKDRFVYKGVSYPISSMERASWDNEFLSSPELVIKFKDGESKYFMVGTISNTSIVNAFLSDFTVNTGNQEIKATTQQFFTTINMLIALSK